MLSYEGRRKPLELRVWESAGNRTGGAISANRGGTENVFSLQDSLVFLDIDTPTKSPECYVLIWEEGKRGYDRKTLELVSSPLCPGRWAGLGCRKEPPSLSVPVRGPQKTRKKTKWRVHLDPDPKQILLSG